MTGVNTLDVASGGITLAAWLGWLPHIATILTIIWMLLRLYDWVEERFLSKEDQFDRPTD
ncbi:hypothetical protein [Pyruvatibacter mobilis]|uniref:hypothetical protein n=1 Tax=Pyruvatibacter mobilis TaxID=1712261 RepID=UPI003BA87ED1